MYRRVDTREFLVAAGLKKPRIHSCIGSGFLHLCLCPVANSGLLSINSSCNVPNFCHLIATEHELLFQFQYLERCPRQDRSWQMDHVIRTDTRSDSGPSTLLRGEALEALISVLTATKPCMFAHCSAECGLNALDLRFDL